MPPKRKRRGKGPTDVPTSKKPKQGEFLIIVSLFVDWNTLHIDKSAASPSKSPPIQPSRSELPVTPRQGACTRCKGRKVKCVYQGGSVECQGCILAKVQCLHVAGVLGPSTSRSKSRRSQSVTSDHSRHSKSPESDHQKANTGNKYRASSQSKHAIGESLLVYYGGQHSSILMYHWLSFSRPRTSAAPSRSVSVAANRWRGFHSRWRRTSSNFSAFHVQWQRRTTWGYDAV